MNVSATARTRSALSGVLLASSPAAAVFQSVRNTRSLLAAATLASAPGIAARWSIHGRSASVAVVRMVYEPQHMRRERTTEALECERPTTALRQQSERERRTVCCLAWRSTATQAFSTPTAKRVNATSWHGAGAGSSVMWASVAGESSCRHVWHSLCAVGGAERRRRAQSAACARQSRVWTLASVKYAADRACVGHDVREIKR